MKKVIKKVKKNPIPCYYLYKMICRKQLPYLEDRGTPIANLWEVRLAPELWARIQIAADLKQVSYSWIVRYCVFRLARRKTLRFFPAMETLNRKIRENQPPSRKCHRHMLCLYGADEKLLKIRAMQLGVNVSVLIRLGLEWFLPKIERTNAYYAARRDGRIDAGGISVFTGEKVLVRKVSVSDFFWRGIKICAGLRYDLAMLQTLPGAVNLKFSRFGRSDWFNIQMGAWVDCPFGFGGLFKWD